MTILLSSMGKQYGNIHTGKTTGFCQVFCHGYFDRSMDFIHGYRASRSLDGELAVIYTPARQELRLNLAGLKRPVRAVWVNPRTGERSEDGEISETCTIVEPPGEGDWILILRHTSSS